MFCPWCGADNPDDSAFCQHCGQRMGPEALPTSQGAAALPVPPPMQAPAAQMAPQPVPAGPGPLPQPAYVASPAPPPAGASLLTSVQPFPGAGRPVPARRGGLGMGLAWLLRLFAWVHLLLSAGGAAWLWVEFRAVVIQSNAILLNTAYLVLGSALLLQGIFVFLLSLVAAKTAQNVAAIRRNTGI